MSTARPLVSRPSGRASRMDEPGSTTSPLSNSSRLPDPERNDASTSRALTVACRVALCLRCSSM